MSDAIGLLAIAIIVSSIGGCIVGTEYVRGERQKVMTPTQICVERAWSQTDRLECIKAGEKK